MPHQRRPRDAYYTPLWCVLRLLEHVELPAGRWLEPAAGNGAILRAVNRLDVLWSAVEIDRDEAQRLKSVSPTPDVTAGDYLTWTPPHRFEVVITNPPFSLADAFLEKALAEADFVVLLLRLCFLGATTRAPQLRKKMPDVYVLPNRPSFLGSGVRDNQEYTWCVWGPGRGGRIEVLPVTPPAERRGCQTSAGADRK